MSAPTAVLKQVEQYLSPPEGEAIRRAYEFARDCHDGQLRESGQPYITHPLAVAETLAELRRDSSTIIAALLHDVSEDCGVALAELETRFGRDVAKLVDGVTKLSKIPWFQDELLESTARKELKLAIDRHWEWGRKVDRRQATVTALSEAM